MAGDWIKMRTDLYRDPKVCVIADLLISADSELSRYVCQNTQRDMTVTRNVMRNVTVGALVSVWGVLRHRGKRVEDDLVVKECALCIIDDIADLPGFGEAMAEVGWAEETLEGVILPRFFEEFNVNPAEDAKKKNADRQRRYREKLKEKSNVTQDVTVASQNNTREEKRREEKSSSKTRGTRFAEDSVLIPEWGNAALEIRADWSNADVMTEFEAFRDYWIAKPGQGGVKMDWLATWRNWCRNSKRKGEMA